jgi:RNA polymerase sigma-70 factor (ECF subfamily)
VLVASRGDPAGRPLYFVLLGWSGEELLAIRDFRYARYVMDGAEILAL